MTVAVDQIEVADPLDAWTRAGFEVESGVTAIDHVVLLSPAPDRTVESFAAVGVRPRRERAGELGGRPIRQIFFRFGEVIVEVVGSPGTASDGPSTLWGITYVVADIDATAAFFGGRTAPVKDAVQPGRRITTLRHQGFGMSVRTAMIRRVADPTSSTRCLSSAGDRGRRNHPH
ncbi:hypothetical protein QGN32_16475 [Mycolicibacterium sp. ND9-15]|uniref:hypothetical protein n=1 Tax=Mycolicibacterium sp. ND9-15 TaxID=3042320 RepID=UPI002DDA527A|nr:hypothetical protein [Mycolicibacterium sp. ND9-15]WSE55042.1 hypothetical protein QGN32_16475 [Mycolicibacterium sp. ND9-15]